MGSNKPIKKDKILITQDSLKRPFKTPASRGWANSAMSCEAPEMQNGMPIPRRRREMRNIATSQVWISIAFH